MTSRTLPHRFPAPWHWDGEDPLDKPTKRVVAQSPENCGYALYGPPALCTCGTCKVDPEGWDYDGLGR